MRLRKQSPGDGDYQFGHNGGDFWHDQPEGVGQSIMTRLGLFSGEWFLDASEGTPWGGFPFNPNVVAQGQILAEHTELSRDMAIKERVISTPGVLAITDYASQTDPNTRAFSVQMNVETIYGGVAITIGPARSRTGFMIGYSAIAGREPL